MKIIDKTDDWDARHPESKIEQTELGKFELKDDPRELWIDKEGNTRFSVKRLEEMMEEMAHVSRENSLQAQTELGKIQPGERNAYSETREEYEKRRLSEGREI